uniref:Uncharacterized protein n=1 Tax=Brassica campestris TaxID=3711 RepID=M4CWF2_BRACM
MDSSGSSLDLTAAVENPSREVADFASRILGPVDRVSDFEIDEVPVYEGLSELGFRDRVPSLVEKVSEELEISSGQLNPPSCIILIALQNLCDLEGLSIGVAEVLYSFAITPLDGGERRYHLHPRGELPVQEVVKEERKRLPVFDGHWTEKVAFMYLPGFSTVWCTADIPSVDPSLGEKTIKQRHASSNTSGSKGEEELAEYKRALEVMSVKKAASKKPLVRMTMSDPTIVLANLNIKVFPLTPVIHPEGDSSASIQLIQGDLFQAMSQLFHLGERMGDHASLKTDLAELTLQLREEKDNILAKEKEIKALKLKVRNQDEDGALATAENVSLREQLEQQEEEQMREWLNHQTDSWDLEEVACGPEGHLGIRRSWRSLEVPLDHKVFIQDPKYFNLPPAVSHNQLWDNLALCSHGIRGILGMLSQNLKVERRIMGSNRTVILLQNPEMLLGPKGHFWSLEAALDPENAFRTRTSHLEPGG